MGREKKKASKLRQENAVAEWAKRLIEVQGLYLDGSKALAVISLRKLGHAANQQIGPDKKIIVENLQVDVSEAARDLCSGSLVYSRIAPDADKATMDHIAKELEKINSEVCDENET